MWVDSRSQPSMPPANCTDVVFRIICTTLPVDHAYQLSSCIRRLVPWIEESASAGIHTVHVAGSQNGWERPDTDSNELLMLSKRTRLRIRVAIADAARLIENLVGETLHIAEHSITLLSAQQRAINPAATLFSRYTCFKDLDSSGDESEFVQQVIEQCGQLGFSPNKVLCGRSHWISCDNAPLLTRSVLLADVPHKHSMTLQDIGLGDYRLMGCGLLIPHKDTGSVEPD